MNRAPISALVTGAAGFIGSHVCDRLIAEGYSVTGLDNLSTGKQANLPDGFDLRQLDILEPGLSKIVDEVKPDLVFHLAAQISVAVSTRAPQEDAKTNILGGINLLESLRNSMLEKTKLIYITSGGTVYGEPDYIPIAETTSGQPLSPYGASKYAFEMYLPVYAKLCGLEYSILRLANVYGPRQDPHGEAGVVAIFTKAMLNGLQPSIYGDGSDTRDYVYVDDVVDAVIQTIDTVDSGPYNVGTGIETSTKAIFQMIADACGFDMPPITAPSRAGDINRIALDVGRARKGLGWSPGITIEAGLKRTVDWFRKDLQLTS